jgi:hypothetical protein
MADTDDRAQRLNHRKTPSAKPPRLTIWQGESASVVMHVDADEVTLSCHRDLDVGVVVQSRMADAVANQFVGGQLDRVERSLVESVERINGLAYRPQRLRSAANLQTKRGRHQAHAPPVELGRWRLLFPAPACRAGL